jgi:hypothetical protein
MFGDKKTENEGKVDKAPGRSIGGNQRCLLSTLQAIHPLRRRLILVSNRPLDQ